jgi:hypothetical protein
MKKAILLKSKEIILLYCVLSALVSCDPKPSSSPIQDIVTSKTIELGNSIVYISRNTDDCYFDEDLAVDLAGRSILIPIVIYSDGKFIDPPMCNQMSDANEELQACDEMKRLFKYSIRKDDPIYRVSGGKKEGEFAVDRLVDYGMSDWTLPCPIISKVPIDFIYTDNKKMGTNSFYDLSSEDHPKLELRFDCGGQCEDKLIDKVDIDGDGYLEFIYECSDYEGIFFQIFSKLNNQWKLVYSGGYDGL